MLVNAWLQYVEWQNLFEMWICYTFDKSTDLPRDRGVQIDLDSSYVPSYPYLEDLQQFFKNFISAIDVVLLEDLQQ